APDPHALVFGVDDKGAEEKDVVARADHNPREANGGHKLIITKGRAAMWCEQGCACTKTIGGPSEPTGSKGFRMQCGDGLNVLRRNLSDDELVGA
ncbi:MAG: hypothetical protein AAFO75_13940, partial [Pseudomonadota bacterium]